jgi:hypothetical protein
MKTRLLAILALLAGTAFAQYTTPSEDAYGGLTAVPCVGGATGNFIPQKLGTKWVMCDPFGNASLMRVMYVTDPNLSNPDDLATTNMATRVVSKYGSTAIWATKANLRLKSLGFNGNFVGNANTHITSVPSIPNPLPFVGMYRPGFYGSTNTFSLLDQPLHTLMFGLSSLYSGLVFSGPFDFYDARYTTELNGEINTVGGENADWRTSVNKNWIIGFAIDDSDQMHGTGGGCDFPMVPATGRGDIYVPWIVATFAPNVAANSSLGKLYPDRTIYSKTLGWQAWVTAKYATIGAVNSAWGSTYTTLGSSGTARTAISLGAGNAVTTTFSGTLANVKVDKYSFLVKVSGTAVAGDIGNGTLYGPTISSGTINYTTGAWSITFSSAPANAAPITADYQQNGWGTGTGLLDEDGHNSWMGTYGTCTRAGINATLQADMDLFAKSLWTSVFTTMRTQIHATFPGGLVFGPDTLGTNTTPPRKEVLQAANGLLDLIEIGGVAGLTQAEIDFTAQYYGDHPIFEAVFAPSNQGSAFSYNVASLSRTGTTVTATITSALLKPLAFDGYGSVSWCNGGAGCIMRFSGNSNASLNDYCVSAQYVDSTHFTCTSPNSGTASGTGGVTFWDDSGIPGQSSQAARATYFNTQWGARHATTAVTSTGNQPIIGYGWWAYADNWGENIDWGIVTNSDNAYDGLEAVSATVTCSAPLEAYTCGGEKYDYGNLLGPLGTTNTALDNILLGTPPPPPTGTVTLTPSSMLYSNTPIGQTASQTFTVSNTRNVSTTILSQTVTGTGFSLNAANSTCVVGLVLTSNTQCSISVVFAPRQ